MPFETKSARSELETSQLLSEQRDLAAEIERVVANIRKTSAEYRTAGNREVRESELEVLWNKFQVSDKILVAELPGDHPYCSSELKKDTEKCVKIGRERLETWASLKAPPVTEASQKSHVSFVGGDDNSPGKNVPTGATTRHPMVPPPAPPTEMVQQKGPRAEEKRESAAVPASRDSQPITPMGYPYPFPPFFWGGYPSAYHERYGADDQFNDAAQTREQQPHAMPSHPMAPMGYPFAWGTGPQPGAQSGQPWAPPGYAYPWGPEPPTKNVGKFTPKLNPISIPKFNGDWQRWARFISLFENIIDSNDDLSAVEKLQYLLNYVEGKAERAIAHVRLCNENYAVALNILRRRFDNPRKICQEYVDTLFNLPKMEADSADGINDIISALNLATEGLQQYGFDTDGWSPVIVACVLRKLDNESTRHFEVSRGENKQVPSVEEVLGFLEARAQTLLNDCNLQQSKTTMKKKSFTAITNNTGKAPNVPSCRLCRSTEHRLRTCEKFLAMTVQQRTQLAKDKNWCFNCLGEHTKNCPSKYSCSECRGKHHTLLHTKPKATLSHVAQNTGQALLATALIKIKNAFGRYETFRALIDPGSQDSFITTEAAEQLALSKTRASVSVSGIGGKSAGAIVGQVEMYFKSHYPNQQQFHATVLVIPKLTENLPDRELAPELRTALPENLLLADPTFAEPGPIDVLLGAGAYAEIIKEGVKKFQDNRILMQNTELGWLITGRINEVRTTRKSTSLITISELHDKLNQFWEIEEIEPQPEVSRQIDVYFQSTTTRDSDGRYIVHLPMKTDIYGHLGGSRNMAIARLINLEKVFAKNPNLAMEYRQFLQEYEDMGHMTKVRPYSGPEDGAYYLPHHAVVKESSTTTKVRVVFNASAKTSTGLSLNSLLEPGHKQQQDLHQIILRWRKHRFVITADIAKMFRQILVTPEQRDLQRIVWRSSPEEPIHEYQLNTVTYGTASATYLAVRTLLQLARDEGHQFPLGQEVLVRDFYMDDLMTGSSDINTVLQVQEQISALLSKGGFSIRKWTSNCREIIDQIPEDLRESGDWFFNPEATLKTLGVVWNPQRDEFRIRFHKEDFNKTTLTKRALLSNIATIFDPLGFLAPISFMCKTWMQQLWTEKTDWDQEVSDEVKRKWEDLLMELPLINEMRVPRWIQHAPGSSCQLHGFSDASEKGYAAVVYSRVVDQLGVVHITLLAAKTKVAPMKNKLTLPRMELAGALLLANLLHDTVKTLEIPDLELYYWCDSQITLAWIAKPPTTWNTYVGNRVAAIQEKSSPSQWRYINTKENPADVASRGCSPAALKDHPLWWSGPQWLKEPLADWPVNVADCSTDLEKRNVTSQSNVSTSSAPNEIISKFSSFTTLVRVVAWIRRFKRHSSKGPRTVGGLTTTELNESRSNVLRLLQNDTFPEEINAIKKSGGLPGKSHLRSLAPFLDENGLLRVGGRLRHSGQAYNVIYPILLPRNHLLTKAIIKEAHERSLHGGAQLTLALLRRSFWISDGRSTVQSVIRSCVRCRRFSAAAATQQMGDLPASRVTPSPAFHRTGIDYCGPFVYRCSKGRGIKTDKCYISVFVCLATKAIHLELVSDLTTDAFLAALKRFVARRGLPFEIHSDNGTNFQGAAREIKAQMKALLKQSTTAAADLLAQDGVNWQFITPYSPHLGGLWEAAVKSVKKHMKRVLDDTKLTFEEFTTVLCQIEACVNSRPLFAVSNDPNDLNALTPGHFLIMRPLLARPEPAVLENNPTKRWHLLSKIHQDFWNRWSTEYLAQLQQRSKWKTSQRNPEVGELVLLKDKALPPAKWALGRIELVHPGADNKVRLVTVRTKSGQVKQPMTNLCSLLLPEKVADQAPKDTAPEPATTTVANVAIVRRKAASQPSLLIRILLMLWIAAATRATTVIKTEPGLYVERIGFCQLKRGTLRLQTEISFVEMRRDEEYMEILGRNLSTVFTRWDQKTHGSAAESQQYRQLFQQFERKRAYITERIRELQVAKQRPRRGLFGKLMTAVFGVNDEVYAELEHLQKGQLTNNQNVLRVSTTLERSHQDLQQQRDKLDKLIRHSQDIIKKLNLEIYRHTLMHHLTAAYLNAMAYLDDVYRKYDALEKAVLGRSNIMELMPLQQVNAALRNATSRLPHGYHVRPIPDQYMETNFTANQLIVSGFFPIASDQMFDLINVTPVPTPKNGTFMAPRLTARTVALNYNEQLHFELTEDQLEACQRTAENMYLCDTPVLSTMTFDSCSLLTEIYNRTGPLRCESTELSITGVMWQKLMRPNTWLFTTNTSTLIAVICKSEREDIHIQGSGIIKLDPGCTIKTAAHTIHSLFYLDQKVMETFIKASPLPLDSPVSKHLELTDPPPFADPMRTLEDLTPLEMMPPSRPLNYVYFSPWALIVLALIGYGLYRWCRCRNRRKPQPPPEYVSVAEALNLRERFDTMLASLPAPQHVQPQLNNGEEQ